MMNDERRQNQQRKEKNDKFNSAKSNKQRKEHYQRFEEPSPDFLLWTQTGPLGLLGAHHPSVALHFGPPSALHCT